MPDKCLYLPRYENSWALVIGINKYKHSAPLVFACNDAEAIADLLSERFAFPASNVTLLKDEEATQSNIMTCFLRFAEGLNVQCDDRILVFFAGHGRTRAGHRSKVGYLVPVDGRDDDLGSLIRWDDLTRNADLICAKHTLFIMDACYGGLAITRSMHPGSSRFLKDMLQRYSRQVLTAGKADEQVADAGGPREGHSVFTGHLLDALEGAASTDDGVLTANAVMAYVYDKVKNDQYSRQTPHYGFIDGDGDFIFSMPAGIQVPGDAKKDEDLLVTVPAALAQQPDAPAVENKVDAAKEYLSDHRHRIKLDGLITAEIRDALARIGDASLPLDAPAATPEQFGERLKRYETAVSDLQRVTIVVARWAKAEQRKLLGAVLSRLSEAIVPLPGTFLWLELRWHPVVMLLYSSGIAALSGESYGNLYTVLTTKVHAGLEQHKARGVAIPLVEGMLEVRRTEIFKTLPGHGNQYVPQSEYIFKALQPALDDVLFLGKSYERLFDQFEVFLALVYADLAEHKLLFWGPPGRFAWKYHGRSQGDNPFSQLKQEADQQRDKWQPLQAGLFGGSYERFNSIATQYEGLLARLPWM